MCQHCESPPLWRKCSTSVDHLMPTDSAPIVSGNLENKISYLVAKLTNVFKV
jgi:hypothetical protein